MLTRIFLLTVLSFLTGCASITESKNQSMSVSTGEVTGAMCTLSNSKGSYYVNSTPGSVMVRNACDQLTVTCKKDGYIASYPGAGTVQDKSKGMAWGNVIFGGIIGIAVDRSTGAGCNYPQQNIIYPMKKVSADSGKNNIEQLKELKELYDTGVITQDEFDKAKKKILN
jgi:hypothetical protein